MPEIIRTFPQRPVADIVRDAREAFAQRDRLALELRRYDAEINELCREYSRAEGYILGMGPETFRTTILSNRMDNDT